MAKRTSRKGAASAKRGRKAATSSAQLRDSIVETMKRIDKHEADIADRVRRSVSGTLRATGTMATDIVDVVGDVVAGVAAGSAAAGPTGTLVAVKAITKGAVLGVADVGGDVAGAAAETARATVHLASRRGADVGLVVQQALRGVGEAAAELGVNAARLAEAGAKGAIEAAAALGTTAADATHKVLTSLSEGVTGVLRAAMPVREQPQRPNGATRQTERAPSRARPQSRGRKAPATAARRRPGRRA